MPSNKLKTSGDFIILSIVSVTAKMHKIEEKIKTDIKLNLFFKAQWIEYDFKQSISWAGLGISFLA